MPNQYISLDSCILDYLEYSEQSNHKYTKCFHIAFGGMDDMGLDFFYAIRTQKLPVNSNKTVNLPADFQKYTKVGVLNDRGEIIPLGYNDKLTNYADLFPDRLAKTQDNALFDLFFFGTPIFYNWWNGNNFINLYGLPSGGPFVGGFKIDNANNIIVLSENFAYDYVMVEYLATPKEGTEYQIPLEFRQAMIAWIAWHDIAFIPAKTHVTNANVGMRRHDYYNKRRLTIAQYRPLYLEDTYEQHLKSMRLAVKA